MTLIHVPYSTSGWIAGQHVRLRVFFSGRIFESHPLTIFSAPPDVSCITSMPQGVSFGVRACGDWSKALNQYALRTIAELQGTPCEKDAPQEKDQDAVEVPVQVMLDGPYGGCSVDLGNYETALLFAGGTGITFTLGILDDIVGRCVRQGRKNGEITRRIEFSWCVRSFGSISWFSPALMDIANMAALSSTSANPIDLHISIYVTCLCNPEAVPPIPNCDVTIIRPSIYRVLLNLTTPPNHTPKIDDPSSSPSSEPPEKRQSVVTETEEEMNLGPKLPWVKDGGGLAVCASGPESLTREASNAVARVQISGQGSRLGGIGLHTEIFTL